MIDVTGFQQVRFSLPEGRMLLTEWIMIDA